MLPVIASIISAFGSGVSGFFGFKQQQGQIITTALQSLSNSQSSDAEYAQACAQAMTALYQNGSPVEKLWRPFLMWVIIGILISRWFFGYTPVGISPTEISTVYMWMGIGLSGYMPLRTVDKWLLNGQIADIIKMFVAKRVS